MNKEKWGASVLGQEYKSILINKLISNDIKWIHYDVMDGLFVNNNSLPEAELKYIFNHTDQHIRDLHLMVNDPLKYIKIYHKIVDYITFHYEAESIDNIKKIFKHYAHDLNLGIAINPQTNVEQIWEFIPDVSHVLIMSVVPGFGGQKFIPETVEKIKKIRKYSQRINPKLLIQIDGGINKQTSNLCFQAGADIVVSGSWLLKNYETKNN